MLDVPEHSSSVPSSINALVLDDNAFDRKRIRRMCEKTEVTMNLVEVHSIEEMRRSIDTTAFDLILIDYSLQDGDGFNALETVQANEVNNHATTIMISGNAQTEIAVDAMKRGFQDFIPKDDMSAVRIQDVVLSAVKRRQAVETPHSWQALDPNSEHAAQFMLQVFQNPKIQLMFKQILVDGLLDAAQAIDQGAGFGRSKEMQSFFSDFYEPTRFDFKIEENSQP